MFSLKPLINSNGTASAINVKEGKKMKKKTAKISNKTKNGSGFTLIEILISLAIIILLGLGIAQLITYSLIINRRSELSLKSAELAAFKLEYLRSLPFKSPDLTEGQNEEKIKKENPSSYYQRKWQIQNMSEHLKKIEIECFPQAYPQKKIHLVLFLGHQLNF